MKTQHRGRTTSSKAAEILGISSNTLAWYRHKGIGPRFQKNGHVVVYRIRDLKEWKSRAKTVRGSIKTIKSIGLKAERLQYQMYKVLQDLKKTIARCKRNLAQ